LKNTLFKAVRDNKEVSDKTLVQLENSEVYLETDARPMYDNNNNVIGGIAFLKDITNDAKQEQATVEILQSLSDTQDYLTKFKQKMVMLL